MPFNRPDLATIDKRMLGDIAARLDGADAPLRRSVLSVLSRSFAGGVHGLYGYLNWLSRQIPFDTADAEIVERWAAIWDIAPQPATAAAGYARFTGNDGAAIPAGTVLQREDALRYIAAAEAVIADGTADVAITAEAAGAAGNAMDGTAFNLISPIEGVESAAAAAGGVSGGADRETVDSLLARLLQRIRKPPQGGALHDYEFWALDRDSHGVPVAAAWVTGGEMGPGTVTVRVLLDDGGLPDAAQIAALQAYIDTLRPITAQVFVVAPIAVPLTVVIAGLDPDSGVVRAAVEAELRDLLLREAAPGGSLLLSHIREAISVAAGEHNHRLVAPTEDMTFETGKIPTFAGVVWN